MAIKLRVISDQYRDLGERRSRVFGVGGGSIGRAPDNDWVLPDPRRVVSGHHCDIEYKNGSFVLRDTSTNGVFVNDSGVAVAEGGPCVLADGDRLRFGDYEVLVSLDERTDFLPGPEERDTAARHVGEDLGASIDLDALLTPRDDASTGGSISMRNAFGLRMTGDRGGGVLTEVSKEPPPPPPSAPPADWALKTRPISREEVNQAIARRTSIAAQREVQDAPRATPEHAGPELKSTLRAFCRGAGIDPAQLSPEAQAQLPLLAGQLLREAVVGIGDVLRSRIEPAETPRPSPEAFANPLRSSGSVEHTLVRLFESHGKRIGGPIDSLREVLQEFKDHDEAVRAAVKSGVEAVLERLSPANVSDQFESGRASRTAPPATDPRPRYWEHYSEFHRLLTQQRGEGPPLVFTEAYARRYEARRVELLGRRRRG